MRVNHTGEICAQGLYNGQAVFASNHATYQALIKSAEEELDHLSWCRDRLNDLGTGPSILDPLWYAASFGLGAGAALISDNVSLGFVHATEDNVERHLREHLQRLPVKDHASRRFLKKCSMKRSNMAKRHSNRAVKNSPDQFVDLCGRVLSS